MPSWGHADVWATQPQPGSPGCCAGAPGEPPACPASPHHGAGGVLPQAAVWKRDPLVLASLPEPTPQVAVDKACLRSLRNGVLRRVNCICKHNWCRSRVSGERGRTGRSEGMDWARRRGIPLPFPMRVLRGVPLAYETLPTPLSSSPACLPHLCDTGSP